MTHNPATHVVIDRCDLSTAAFWLGQLARWLDDPNHASQFSWDLFGVPEDYQPPLTVVLAHLTQPLLDALQVGPNQTVNPGPNELDTSTRPWKSAANSPSATNRRREAPSARCRSPGQS